MSYIVECSDFMKKISWKALQSVTPISRTCHFRRVSYVCLYLALVSESLFLSVLYYVLSLLILGFTCFLWCWWDPEQPVLEGHACMGTWEWGSSFTKMHTGPLVQSLIPRSTVAAGDCVLGWP